MATVLSHGATPAGAFFLKSSVEYFLRLPRTNAQLIFYALPHWVAVLCRNRACRVGKSIVILAGATQRPLSVFSVYVHVSQTKSAAGR